MQHNQSGERVQGKEQVTPPPRVRVGTRAAMRVTNRYTMPPLTPRGQQHIDLFWNAQSQDEEVVTSSYQPQEPLSPAGEDAWLNDVLPPPRPVRSPGSRSGEARATEAARATARVAPTLHAPNAAPVEPGYGRSGPRGRPGLHDRPDSPAHPDIFTRSGSSDRPGFSPIVSDPIWPGHALWPVVYGLSERVCQELTHRRAIVERNDGEIEGLARECAVDILR